MNDLGGEMRSTRRSTFAQVCFWISLLALAGCEQLAQYIEAPEVRLAGVELLDASLSEQSFQLQFEVTNTNAFPIPVAAINYALDLAGQRFVSGTTSEAFSVPANGQNNFSIAVRTDLISSARTLAQIVIQGGQNDIDYKLGGDVRVNLAGERSLPFEQNGTVTLQR